MYKKKKKLTKAFLKIYNPGKFQFKEYILSYEKWFLSACHECHDVLQRHAVKTIRVIGLVFSYLHIDIKQVTLSSYSFYQIVYNFSAFKGFITSRNKRRKKNIYRLKW
jgi:hypothetical protein